MRLLSDAWKWIVVPSKPLAEDPVRAQWATYLQTDPDAQVDTSEVIELLLREVKYTVDSKLATIRATEGKAIAQVGLLGGGLGIISVIGASQSSLEITGNILLLGLACAALLIAAASDAACISRGHTELLPQLDIFNAQAIVSDRRMNARVGMSISEGYSVYSNDLTALSMSKGRLLRVATYSLVVGVFLLVANGVWVDTHQSPGQHPLAAARCRISGATIVCEVKH